MKITFEKRIYNIEDGDDVYKLTEIIKHPIEEYDYRHIADGVLKYKEYTDYPECNGFVIEELPKEILDKLQNCINQNKDG